MLTISPFQEALASRIAKKIEVLRAEQICLKEETKLNDDLGRAVSVRVMQLAQVSVLSRARLLEMGTDYVLEMGTLISRRNFALPTGPVSRNHLPLIFLWRVLFVHSRICVSHIFLYY